MKKFIGIIGLGIVLSSPSALASNPHKIKSMPAKKTNALKKMSSQMFKVDPFDKISVNGPIHVEIIAGTPLHDIRLLGNKDLVDCIKIESVGNELRVNLISDAPPPGRVVAIIRASQFNRLKLVGKGQVKGIDLNTPKLDIHSEYAGMIDLKGRRIGLEKLRTTQPGMIRISGVDTGHLNLNAQANNVIKLNQIKRLDSLDFAGNGTYEFKPVTGRYLKVNGEGSATTMMLGVVENLELNLFGNATFDGRELEAHTAFIKTHNLAQAHCHVTQAQHALAMDNSDILFYNNSHFIGSEMMGSGAVLNYARVAPAQ